MGVETSKAELENGRNLWDNPEQVNRNGFQIFKSCFL